VRKAAECHIVAVPVGIKPADVVARGVGERQRPIWITRALLKIVSGTTVLWYSVVASTIQEVTAENRVARGCVVEGRVVFIAFVIQEILAVCRRIVATEYSTTTARSDWMKN